jgi:hypothetical protein
MEILSDPGRLLAESKLEIILADEPSAETGEVELEVEVDESFVETDMTPALPPVAPVVGRNAYAW